jgi:hypothetical protein
MRTTALQLTLPLLLLVGCGASQHSITTEEVGASAQSSATVATVELPPRVNAHDAATVDVTFRPPEGTSFTAGYPLELSVDRPFGDTITETVYGVRDVRVREDDTVVFQIRIAPSVRGRTDYTASFRHSVCFPGRCEISTLALGWSVEVD